METPIKANHEFKDEMGTPPLVIKAAGRGTAIFTMPDIAFAIIMNSQYMHCHTAIHLEIHIEFHI